MIETKEPARVTVTLEPMGEFSTRCDHFLRAMALMDREEKAQLVAAAYETGIHSDASYWSGLSESDLTIVYCDLYCEDEEDEG